MEFLLLIAIAGFLLYWIVAGGAALSRFRRKRIRRAAMQHAAGDLGWTFSDRHPIDGVAFGFRARGDGSGMANFVSGTRDGLRVIAFDAWTYINLGEGRTPVRRYTWYTCAAVQLPVRWPHLTIARESRTTRLLDRTGSFGDIDFESEEFNRMFEVNVTAPLTLDLDVGFGRGGLRALKAGLAAGMQEARRWQGDGKRFAHAFVDPRMMEWLMQGGGRYGFEVLPGYLLCYAEQPADLRDLVDRVMAFHQRIPRVVYELFPAEGRDPTPHPADEAPSRPPAPSPQPPAAPQGSFPAGDVRNSISPDELPLRADDPRIPELAKVIPPEQLRLLLGQG